MKALRLLLMPALLVSGLTSAGEAPYSGFPAPLRPTLQSLNCGSRLRAFSDGTTMYCATTVSPGVTRPNGPAVTLHQNGTKASEGQYIDGNREGVWSYFDAAGNRTKQIEFKADHYHGKFVQYTKGRKVLEHNYIKGLRQGPQLTFDATGKSTAVEYRDDRPASK